jgi:hypothetical protein
MEKTFTNRAYGTLKEISLISIELQWCGESMQFPRQNSQHMATQKNEDIMGNYEPNLRPGIMKYGSYLLSYSQAYTKFPSIYPADPPQFQPH